jgi:hypothetical protein
MQTPWGTADYAEQLTEEVVSVGTPSHGGIKVIGESLQRIPEGYRTTWAGELGWYEEDSDWIVPAYFLHEVGETMDLGRDYINKRFREWQERHDPERSYTYRQR